MARYIDADAFKKQVAGQCIRINGETNRAIALIELIEKQPKADPWIMCSDRMPEEHDSMFKRFKGTNKWNNAMFENISDKVNVTIEFENGKRATDTSYTLDRKWRCEKEYGLGAKVIAWQPLPEPFKEKGTL